MKNFSTFVRLKKLTPRRFLQLVAKGQIKLQSPNARTIQKTMSKIASLKEKVKDQKGPQFHITIL